jgi:DNA repair exonuclease SbcCD ATPase subunit
MLYFKKIRWKNLLSTGNVFTEIQLDRNKSTLIVGNNGAGKSTLVDALSFVLFNKPFRSVTKGQLLNTITQKGLVVEVEFSTRKSEYLVKRGIKPNVFEVYCNGNLINQNADVKDYQDVLEKNVLKLNHKSFNQIVVLGSANFVPFMQLPTGNRRLIIEDLLDLQIFTTMNTILKEKISTNKTAIIETNSSVQHTEDKIEMQKTHLAKLKENNDDIIKKKNDKIAEFKKKKTKLETDYTLLEDKRKEYSEKTKNLDSLEKKLAEFNLISSQLSTRLKKLEKTQQFFHDNENCPTCQQGIEEHHKHSIVEKSKQKEQEVLRGSEQLSTNIEKIQNQITELNKIVVLQNSVSNTIADNIRQQKSLEQWVSSLNEEISELSKKVETEDNNIDLKELNETLEAFKKKLKEELEQREILESASLLLKDGGIKSKIIKQYIPIINRLINKYLSQMDFFVDFQLDENFGETIRSRFRDKFSYASFSEGEKMRIDLALLFTWRAVAKIRNSSTTNLLIMDEVFDSSLDLEGTDDFIKMLNDLTQDTNTFIISHKGDALYDKFHSVIKFEKIKNFSRMGK